MRPLIAVLSTFLAVAQGAELPVREVILYKSGVGYFERQGQLGAGESARLDFKAVEMNDVLKSLIVNDLKGGKVTGLRYDSSLPLDQKLAEFPFKLGDHQSLSAFLDQVKGAAVELKSGAETAAGSVLGARSIAATAQEPAREQLVLMLGNGELRTYDLTGVSSIRFADPKVQLQLKDYLATVSQSRSLDKRSVYIDSSDAQAREIEARYMIPAPVWKSSYRLVFGEKSEPTLEGWAIVDNTTGDDWTNVRLAVVSGRPVSFVSSLYEPRFLQRPTVDLPEDEAVAPTVYNGAMDLAARPAAGLAVEASPAAPPPPAPASIVQGVGGGFGRVEQFARLKRAPAVKYKDDRSTVAVETEGRDLGDLFEYRFANAVTVKKNESAMLPFLQQSLGARKLLIYRSDNGTNPMSAAEITNSTGKTLDGGPITVFDGNSYSGEALVETLKAGDKRLIDYAVDLGTRITTKFDSTNNLVRQVHLSRGLLTIQYSAEETKTYTIRNVDQKAKTLIVEQPQRDGYKVLTPKPVETTTNSNRFEAKLAPDSTQKLVVKEEHVFNSETMVSSLGPDVLLDYVQNKSLSEAARTNLSRIASEKNKIAALDREIQQTQTTLNNTISDEQRIRQNIDSLRMVRTQEEQVNKYAAQLAAQETQIAGLRDKISQLQKDRAALQTELEGMIATLEF